MTNTPIRTALLSVSDKSGLADFAKALHDMGVTLISTGGTARTLRDAGLPVRDVAEITNFPEMLDGRVKTLHPAVHGGLLARRDSAEHMQTIEEHNITPIDLVVVNLYPFEETIAKPGVTDEDAIENIDIGGPSMLRSAAKNHAAVTVACDPAQYNDILADLRANNGATSYDLRRRLAQAVYARTAAYDKAIADYMASEHTSPTAPTDSRDPVRTAALGARMDLTCVRTAELRYGENPHQAASVYKNETYRGPSVVTAQQLHGKPLSYNNLLDASAALELVLALRRANPDGANACVVKHTNPCGAAHGATPAAATQAAIAGDPLAAFGGILALDTDVNLGAAELICGPDRFFEVVVAPSFTTDALARLQARWANVRLLAVGDPDATPEPIEHRSIPGGLLAQERDLKAPDTTTWTHAAGPAPSADTLRAGAMLEAVVRALTSNAVCIGGVDADATRLYGAGAGQMDRVASCRLAIEKAGDKARGAIALSDAFFPFPDGPQLLINAGVTTIAHPGGSKRDQETFDLCNTHGVTCLTTGVRRFRH